MIDLSSLLEKLEGEDMETKRKEIKLHFAKSLILCIRTIGRVFHYHLLMSIVVFFLLVFYWSFPSLFTFLVSSSPVIVCTTLLLGLLLSYGELNIPEIEEEHIWDDGCMDIVSSTNYLCVQETENLSIGNHVDSNEDELHLRETEIQEEKDIVDVDNFQTTKTYEENKKPDALMIKISSGEEVKQESHVLEDVLNQELQGQCFYSYRNLCVDEVGGVTEMGKNAIPFCIANLQETENSNLEIHKPALDHHFDSPLGLPLQSVEDHHAPLDGESDGTESCSPDVPLDDIIPMLDELHTILNSDLPEHTSIAKLDAISEQTLADHETDNNIISEKDGEAQEAKDDGSDAAGKWTEGDQKSVMDLGSSELERDRRLESLIAKRRARKNLTFRMERNLIDLVENDSLLRINELSHFRIQVPSRRNPFNMLNDSRETMDFPPVPGSAPSLLPGKSLFDVFYDQQDQDSSLDVRNCDWDFVPPSHHETLFRSDTFGFGRRHFQQERYNSRLKPYFTSERDLEGNSTFNRQFSEKSQAKVIDISDSDTVSSAIGQENQRDLEKLDVSRKVESSSLAKQDTEAEDHETPYEAEPEDTEEGKCEHLIKDGYDYKIAEPIYDSSPPASGNSLYKESAFDEALQDSGQLGDADSSLEFNMRMDSVKVSSPRALEIAVASEKVSSPRALEIAVASETADFISSSANIEESGSISMEPSTSSWTSVSNDEKVRTKEFDDINQYDDAKIGKSATQEDSSDLASSVIQEMQTAQCVNDPNELHQIHVDVSCGMEGRDMAEIFLSDGSVSSEFQKGLPSPFVHVDVDECQSSILDLSSISEENQEHLEQKIDNLSCTDVLSSSRELSSDHRVELMVHKDDWYEDIISDSKSSFEHDFSLSKDRSSLIVGTLDNQFSKDSFGMPQEVDSEINQTEIVGAHILSPLGSEGNNEETVYNPTIHFLETILVRGVDSESSQLSEEDIRPSVLELDIDNPSAAELLQSSEIGTTQQTVSQSMTDSELTVIEARSIEEIHSYVKKFSEESPNKHVPQFTTDSKLPVIEEARRSNEESLRKRIYQTIEESEFSVVEARTDEGIHLYFEQSGEERESKPIHHDDGSQYLFSNVDMDTKLRKSDLHVVEAKSIEDIDMAYIQLSHITSKEYLEAIKTGVLEVCASDDISLDLKKHFSAQTGSSIETGNVGEKNQEKIKY
ncbi:uncharacterized protein LOC121967777 isoform X2 [Zingiber officinale]|uniref:Uncharacterized protein n=1 Tax=Zingiber officinale TaxID=94328 RepID=A0A8J5LKQ0_ZINOF|nr:uncharacterized protein LOC121967777 isoform X2 [Zingiber officinale]KAG6519648.1 hypothetical protein ZIOFF_023145 [Zingiber officinale]